MTKPKPPLVFSGRVRDGVLHLDKRALFDAALKAWNGRVTVTVAPEVERRRERANRYYHGVVLKLMAEESGHTADELHELMKLRHLSASLVDPITGEERRYGKSTAVLSIAGFAQYLEHVMLDGAEWLGISFPPPRRNEEYRQAEDVA